ncbi:major facilitator superfamily domain-containing protein [Vararia minispora EC-137]|uniref:Major facilitator superfamily domain-containing protein n=1 Tax=Vararia minispora EC-137 TaxID=1314806 RepID=A0ACB8QLR7_9AGAM|nr:major facilitator superfamily domain-containing protein [Vararia minispora EC-137]
MQPTADASRDPTLISLPLTLNAEKSTAESSSLSDLNYIPDGGLRAWLQVVGGFGLILNSWGIFNAYGAFQTFYEQNVLRANSASSIAWIGSIQGCLLLFTSFFAGPIFDMGCARPLIYTGSVLITFGMMMTSLCTKFYQVLLAQGIVVGLGGGCIFVPSVAIIATYFKTRRAFASGVALTGSSIGGVIYTAAFRQLSAQIGFPWATRVVAFIAFGVFLVSLALLRPRPVRKGSSRRHLIDKSAWTELPYVLFVAGMTLGFMSAYIPYFYINTFAAARTGASADVAFYFVAVLNAASTVGRTLPNFIADRTGPLNILVPSVLVSGTLGLAWIAVRGIGALSIWAVLFGFFSGTFVSLPPASVASLTEDLTRVGTRMGMAFTFMGVGLLVGNPIAGALINLETGNFLRAQIFCGVLVLASGLVLAAARVAKVGWALRAKA